MNILAICCALNNTYLGFEFGEKSIHKIIKSDENYHSLYLISKIKQIIKENNFSLNDLNLICVNAGPGSFTGIRVALTVAKVIAGELEIPLVALNTSEILLKEFDNDYLIMDARRDMYFIGTKNEINLVYKDKIPAELFDKKVLCDKNSSSKFKNSICFEDIDKNVTVAMIELAKNKYLNSTDKEEFKYSNVKANYIQTPPIF